MFYPQHNLIYEILPSSRNNLQKYLLLSAGTTSTIKGLRIFKFLHRQQYHKFHSCKIEMQLLGSSLVTLWCLKITEVSSGRRLGNSQPTLCYPSCWERYREEVNPDPRWISRALPWSTLYSRRILSANYVLFKSLAGTTRTVLLPGHYLNTLGYHNSFTF